jgi:Fe-Mn family superoxide dismutase
MTDRYVLPDLPYALDALEPWCPAETLELHHGKHHATYVKEANEAADRLSEADPDDIACVAGLRAALTFNLSGHVLHSLFWTSLTPAEDQPSPELTERIMMDFGSHERFIALLTSACAKVQGSGWGALSVDRETGELHVGSIHDHQNMHVPTSSLVAVIDVWEHAYYLTYRNDRASWAKAAVGHLDWKTIGERYASARSAMSSLR